MAYLTWSDEFSIGVPVFDEEHRHLIDICNGLSAAITAGTDPAGLRKLEDVLFAHVAAHFRHEEMFFADYPYAEEHAGHHRILLARVGEYREAMAEPNAQSSARMLDFLSGALLRHIVQSDKKLGAHLCAQQTD